MSEPNTDLSLNLRLLSTKLQELHYHTLEAEREFDPAAKGLALLERLANDPAWAWLRSISSLIAEIDHVLATATDISGQEGAAVAARVRGLLFGEGEFRDETFLERYRALLPYSAPLASVHGEIKQLLDRLPDESQNESERLHARHVWNMRCEHGSSRLRRPPARSS
jgi:hypothetical protein